MCANTFSVSQLTLTLIVLSAVAEIGCRVEPKQPQNYGVWADRGGTLKRLEGPEFQFLGRIDSVIVFDKSVPMMGTALQPAKISTSKYIGEEVELIHEDRRGPVIEMHRRRGGYWVESEESVPLDFQPVSGQPEMIRLVPRESLAAGGYILEFNRKKHIFGIGTHSEEAHRAATVDKQIHTVTENSEEDITRSLIRLADPFLPDSEKTYHGHFVFKTELVSVGATNSFVSNVQPQTTRATSKLSNSASKLADVEAYDQEVASQITRSQNNMKQMGLVFRTYSNGTEGERLPPISTTPGLLMCESGEIFPEYLSDPTILLNPGSRAAESLRHLASIDPIRLVSDQSYVYLGYVVMNDEDVEFLARTYASAVASGKVPTEDIELGGRTLYRLREGIERFFMSDIKDPAASVKAQASIPTLIERPSAWAEKLGVNVLYLDGHVGRTGPGDFPNTSRFWESIDKMNGARVAPPSPAQSSPATFPPPAPGSLSGSVAVTPSASYKVAINGIGPVRLGMFLQEMEKSWDGGFHGDQQRYGTSDCFFVSPVGYGEDAKFWIVKDQLRHISVTSSSFSTKSGAKVGDPRERLAQLYGDKLKVADDPVLGLNYTFIPSDAKDAAYRLRFYIREDRIVRIDIGTSDTIDQSEFCL